MIADDNPVLSVVVPLFNEAQSVTKFHAALRAVLKTANLGQYEIIYCDDGSSDATVELVGKLADKNPQVVRLLRLSRNFGKENALTAGIAHARGQAILMIDGDGQHPVELIPDFVQSWRQGARVVVGVRRNNQHESHLKRWSSTVFYKWYNRLSRQRLIPGSSDFRLIDRMVAEAFLALPETNRITRGLIDWLGFRTDYISFDPNPRIDGKSTYDHRMLLGLAVNSLVSLSPLPLYIFGCVGIFLTFGSLLLGLTIIVEQLLLGDPLSWNFTGTAMLSILMLFMIGLVLLSQGLLSLYVSHIHNQAKQRLLYVVDYHTSRGVAKPHA
jgi:glycosyltransferase involved in cell wall biosynthesis